ncbi:MAG: IS66 family insertion sequence element accessory protein TnpB [Thiohalomonadaceae bacterium]
MGGGAGAGVVMMRPSNDLPAVYLCIHPVDFRKGINGLSALVEAELELDPFSEQLFVFVNRSRDKVKLLYWEATGFCLWLKRLEQARFAWPTHLGTEVATLTGQQLNWLLDGIDLRYVQPHQRLRYKSAL